MIDMMVMGMVMLMNFPCTSDKVAMTMHCNGESPLMRKMVIISMMVTKMKMVMLMNCPCATNGGGDSNCKQNENGDLD